ncbi:unnamed protein product [Enterobius vermicularis]|uniref:Glycosyltransferase family 92 protein n=1 Tax=Enterobius vermicularis TaxID=51028 RepID=A0A0N4UT21_ENTVE|nr:unnamed protein product [Enterobius vermicularis]
MQLGGAKPVDMILHPFEECPTAFVPRCLYNGQYGTANNLNYSQIALLMKRKEKLHIFYPDQPERKVSLDLTDSRLQTPQRRLTVCAPPIEHYATWTVLPRSFYTTAAIQHFFNKQSQKQMWINHGATKFIFYQQTFSKEVDALIRMYEHDKTIEIERVPWGIIPLPENTPEEEDPNKQVYRAEQVLAWNDCILRSRGKTEYLALADFDEVFVLYNNQSFLSFLDSLLEKEPNAGSFSFLSATAFMQVTNQVFNQHTYSNATNPSQIQFDDHYEIQVENQVFPHGSMSKVVVIPERIKSEIVHESLSMEKPFTKHVVDPKVGKILHLRLERLMYDMTDLHVPTTVVARYVPAWSRRYKEVLNKEMERLRNSTSIAGLTLKTQQWKNNGIEAMKELTSCFDALWNEDKVCPTRHRCLARLQTMKYNEWVSGGSNWAVL